MMNSSQEHNSIVNLYQFSFKVSLYFQELLNPNYALGFRHESLNCKENGSSTVLSKRRRGHHHGEHQKSWTFPLSKQFQLVIDILMHISGLSNSSSYYTLINESGDELMQYRSVPSRVMSGPWVIN